MVTELLLGWLRAAAPRTSAGSDVDRAARHARKVERIASQLRHRRSGAPLSLRKRSVSHQVPKAGNLKYSDERLDIGDLDEILVIDPQRRICVAESGVTFVDLVRATLRHGLVPIIVPELKTITVGGAVSGCSIESMSFRHGGFHDSCLEYEVITARGEVITCRPDGDDSLLFEMMHGTFGTLGILSKLTFRLIPATPFVRVDYQRHATLGEYRESIWRCFQRGQPDFVDGIIHAGGEWVLNLGRFVPEAPYTNRYDWLKVYHASTRTRRQDYLRTPDYFFRYDRGVTNVHPRTLLGRLLLGKFLGSSQLLRLAETFNGLMRRENPTVIVDLFIPFSRVPAFFDWYQEAIGHFPLWCVPYRVPRPYPWLSDEFHARCPDRLFLDLAIYGLKQPNGTNYHLLLEQKLLELGGVKTLISHNYYSEGDFWRIFNKRNYDAVKARTDPDHVFRDLYTKTCRAARGLA